MRIRIRLSLGIIGWYFIYSANLKYVLERKANGLDKKAEESKEAIQKNNAHKSVNTQLIYQEGHDLPFDDAPIQFTAEQIGGDFK